MFFQRIGASGYALGAIKTVTPPIAPSASLRYASFFDGLRETMDRRMRAVIPGDEGAIASALITGKRDAITTPVNDAMYISSLAHVLSISGYHIAVVAGIVFFFVRAGLARIPSLASRQPIKKWAAAAALFAATFYLLLSGSEVATQRSYIMIGIVLVGVMADRPAITFRTLTVAALGVLLFAPEAVVHPSFQMSFAATLALVSAYQVVKRPRHFRRQGMACRRRRCSHRERPKFARWRALRRHGCIGKLADGKLVSFALAPEAFAEDCARAVVVVSPRAAPGDCGALLVDRKVWLNRGATALRWSGERFEQSAANPPGYERPWAPVAPIAGENAPVPQQRPTARDATPREDDMEAGD
jgi:ComEC/Rec2-related protein